MVSCHSGSLASCEDTRPYAADTPRCGLTCCRFQTFLEDAAFAMELADLEASSNSPGTSAAADSELASLLLQAKSSLQQLAAGLDKWELRILLSGPYDEAGALLTITAGAGEVQGQGCTGMDSTASAGYAALLLQRHACQ